MDIKPQSLRAFISQVDTTGGPDACWPWRGSVSDDGYGRFGAADVGAHRLAYTLMRQPIPAGLVVDHTCHNDDTDCPGGHACPHRRCVNPMHLQAVRQADNVLASRRTMPHRNAAKTHCPRDHEYTPENTRHSIGKYGPRRECRACIRDRSALRTRAT